MGTIEIIAKYNLLNNEWNFNPDLIEYGRSFAFANYEKIINNDQEKIDYIIIDQGSRVEDHSKDYINIKEKEVKIDNVISYYKRKNRNYVIKLFLMDADAPIIEDAKLFARCIDNLSSLSTTNSINIIGLSKCSVMNFYIPNFFQNPKSFSKTNMYNIAAPYTGAKLASPLIFYPEVKKLISSKIGDNIVSNKIYKELINFYEKISSNSHMDYDIAVSNGISQSKYHVYDENFIKNVFCVSNLEAIKNLKTFKNFITGIDKDTLKESIRTMNMTGIGLCILDDLFFDNKSDGMVYTDSQREVEKFLDIKSKVLVSTHHDVNSNTRAFNEVLWIVDDTIEENNQILKKCK